MKPLERPARGMMESGVTSASLWWGSSCDGESPSPLEPVATGHRFQASSAWFSLQKEAQLLNGPHYLDLRVLEHVEWV